MISSFKIKIGSKSNFLRLVLLSLALICFSTNAYAQRADVPIKLHKNLRGAQAINALGDKITKVARDHNLSPKELKALFRRDKFLVLDKNAKLFYDEPVIKKPSTAKLETLAVESSAINLADTFKLHSLASATRKIYLDFDGHKTTGTNWNTSKSLPEINTPAYDFDGNTASFSDNELQRIQYIWRRVSEDFSSYNVDVTTEDPGAAALTKSSSTDTEFGIRVVIGGSSSSWYGASAGGVAYLGSFSWASDTPCFVFEEQLANGTEKYVAEAISHEVGHTISLRHDGVINGAAYYNGHGSGATGWASIMGVGYYKELTQWSKGEYLNANNTEDDLVVMQNHIQMLTDDHGNTTSTATVASNNSSFTVNGLIHSRSDVDVFRVESGTGTISIFADPAITSPTSAITNLDAEIKLLSGNGQVILSSNPSTMTNSSLSANVSAGTYYISIEGVGKGDVLVDGYSDYGSIGRYKLSATLSSAGNSAPVAVISQSTLQGTAPLSINFSATSSYDVDGSIVGYSWDFGNGTSSTSSSQNVTFSNPGIYNVTLAVTDNLGSSGQSSVQVVVLANNLAPTASITASATTGVAPITISFDASGSIDSDGSIASYFWEFGNGLSATTTTPIIQHSYNTGGSFMAKVTVTDNLGASSSSSIQLSIQSDPSKVIRVSSITLSVIGSGSKRQVRAAVKITNQDGTPVIGAKVTGSFSGVVTGSPSATTDASGTAILTSRSTNKTGTVQFTVLGVQASGTEYNPSLNSVSSSSIRL